MTRLWWKGHWRGDSECPKVKSGETKRFSFRSKGKGVEKSTFVLSGGDVGSEWLHVNPESLKRSQEEEQKAEDREAPKVRVVAQTANADSGRTIQSPGASSTSSPKKTRESLTSKTIEELRDDLRSQGLSTRGRKSSWSRD